MADVKFLSVAIAVAAALGLVAYLLVSQDDTRNRCRARGGYYLETRYDSVCLRKDAVLP